MDPFTQRMLERARARQEKIDQKLASSGQSVPKRKPFTENVSVRADSVKSPVKAIKELVNAPKKSPRRSSQNREVIVPTVTPQRLRNDVVITKKELRRQSGESKCEGRRSSDMSVEISIKHSDDIQIEVQVEEREAPINVVYGSGSGVVIKEIEDNSQKEIAESKSDKTNVRQNFKSRLDRLGNLYSDNPNISSPIHRTESEFSAATPPSEVQPPKVSQSQRDGKKKFGRLAALADQINNWEDDTTPHTHQIDSEKPTKTKSAKEKLDASTLDVSIHSISDINKVLKTTPKSKQQTPVNSSTYTKPSTPQHLNKNIVAELEPKCASTTPSAASAPKMATMVAGTQNNTTAVTKKPSIKKYRAPTPPRKSSVDGCESDKDKENNVVDREENDNEPDSCVQTKQPADDDKPGTESPVIRRLAPKLTGNVDRNSVLSRAAMFEAGSPRAKEKDPAEMSLRERKALFEKNKGAAIVPKAPFGQAPSVKTLHGVNKADKPAKPVVQKTNSRSNSKENLPDDNISQSSFGGGIKGKLAALFNREQTISESTIANKFKQEREKEMEVLQNRFNYKPPPKPAHADESDDDQSDNDPSEKAPLMGSTTSLSQLNKKPEIIANIPKVTFDDKAQSEPADKEAAESDKVVGAQPCKRRSSQDSPVVLSVVDEVKRIKVNDRKEQANGAVVKQPTLYPHLSDIETDTSNTQEEYSECGGSSSDNPNEALNKSDNWGDTSFGREVLNVVKKNNSSYKKAVRDDDSDSSHSACDSELDDMLDEALDANSDGPTPPKLNKGSMSSTSFEYKNREFKSPLKHPATPATPRHDKANELVHSISFYRRMQNASSNPSTPLRVIRHGSPEREMPETPDEPSAAVPVRQRIKELQAEIAKQQTVISQASQALNLCAATIEFSGSTEQAEGERLLLLATHRRQACVHEVQRLQVEGAGAAAAAGMASLSIKGITVPLRRDYVRHLNADGAVGHYGVCLVKCRDRVAATAMVRTRTDSHLLHFADHIRMDGLAKDFKVTVEVYLLQASKEILSHELKYHIGSKKGSSKLLTPKSKMSSLKAPRVESPAGPLAVRSPQFQLHGYCIFALQQANRKTFTLNKVPCGSPLEGSVNVELAAHLRVNAPPPRAAFLTAFEDVAGLGAWHRRWFRLHPPATNLAYWKYPDDVHKKLPMGDIDLTSVVSERVTKAPRDLCARPNTLLLETSLLIGMSVPESGSLIYVRKPDGSMVRRHLLAADTAQDRDMWLDSLNKALEYVRCCHPEEE